MLSAALSLVVIAACALLNRVRGDASWMPAWLPGRALFYVTPAIGVVAFLLCTWPVALTFAVGYLFWAVWSWGYVLAAMAGFKPDREPTALECWLMRLPGVFLPAFARMLFVLPCVIGVSYLTSQWLYLWTAPLFALAAALSYRLLFRTMGSYDWPRAEVATGALFGALIAVA